MVIICESLEYFDRNTEHIGESMGKMSEGLGNIE